MDLAWITACIGVAGTLAAALLTNWQAERRRSRDQERDDRLRREDRGYQREVAWRSDLYAAYASCYTPLMDAAAAARGFAGLAAEGKTIERSSIGDFASNCLSFNREAVRVQLVCQSRTSIEALNNAQRSAQAALTSVVVQAANLPEVDFAKINDMTVKACAQLHFDYIAVLDQFRADLGMRAAGDTNYRDERIFDPPEVSMLATAESYLHELMMKVLRNPNEAVRVDQSLAKLHEFMQESIDEVPF